MDFYHSFTFKVVWGHKSLLIRQILIVPKYIIHQKICQNHKLTNTVHWLVSWSFRIEPLCRAEKRKKNFLMTDWNFHCPLLAILRCMSIYASKIHIALHHGFLLLLSNQAGAEKNLELRIITHEIVKYRLFWLNLHGTILVMIMKHNIKSSFF